MLSKTPAVFFRCCNGKSDGVDASSDTVDSSSKGLRTPKLIDESTEKSGVSLRSRGVELDVDGQGASQKWSDIKF